MNDSPLDELIARADAYTALPIKPLLKTERTKMEFPYYVVNIETWHVAAGFASVLDADAMVKRYNVNGDYLRAVRAAELRKYHEDKQVRN